MEKDYKKILDILKSEVNEIFEKNNQSTDGYLVEKADNKIIHEQILQAISNHLSDSIDIVLLTHECRQANSKIIQEKMTDETLLNFNLYYIIKCYLMNFYNSFFYLKDGNAVVNHREQFVLPHLQPQNTQELILNDRYLKAKAKYPMIDENCEIALLIIPDGTCYFAPIDHLSLAHWLNVNGIDINNAVRVKFSKDVETFCISSLYNCEYSIESNENEKIIMTDEQAKVIGGLYQTVRSLWNNIKPLEDTLNIQTGFGFSYFDYDQNFAQENLNKLGKYTNGLFDEYKYFKELKHKFQDSPNQ